jgi:hypothetical protein
LEDLTLKRGAFLILGMETNTAAKEMLSKTFDAAKKEIADRKEAAAKAAAEKAAKEAAAKEAADQAKAGEKKEGETKDGDTKEPPKTGQETGEKKQGGEPKPQAKDGGAKEGAADKQDAQQPKRTDPNLLPVIDVVEGKLPAFAEVANANELLHFLAAMKDHPQPIVFLTDSAADAGLHLVADRLAKAKAKVVIPPSLATEPHTRVVVNPALELERAGVEFSFGLGSTAEQAERVFFQLIELMRAGLPEATAVAAVTVRPARLLGVADRVGSIAKGKDANLLLFSGSPFEPTSRMLLVLAEGRMVVDRRSE